MKSHSKKPGDKIKKEGLLALGTQDWGQKKHTERKLGPERKGNQGAHLLVPGKMGLQHWEPQEARSDSSGYCSPHIPPAPHFSVASLLKSWENHKYRTGRESAKSWLNREQGGPPERKSISHQLGEREP